MLVTIIHIVTIQLELAPNAVKDSSTSVLVDINVLMKNVRLVNNRALDVEMGTQLNDLVERNFQDVVTFQIVDTQDHQNLEGKPTEDDKDEHNECTVLF